MMKPTIQTIADYAGVSRGTVDRVLHGRPNVHPDKRQRVEDALRKLGYSPNAAARALALKTRNLKIGVVLPHWIGSFATEVKRGIENARAELGDYGLGVLMRRCKTELAEESIDAIDSLVEEGARGLAVCVKNSASIRRKLTEVSRRDIPVVTFNSDIPECGRICFVGENVVKSGRIAGELMVKLLPGDGTLLVVCGNLEFEGHQGRVAGFSARLAELNVAADRLKVVETYNDYDATFRKVRRHSAGGNVRGIYMANESVPGCVEALRRAGAPGAVRVICHDLSETTVRLLRDGWVDFVIEQNLFRQGYLPATILANLLIAGKRPEQEIDYARIQIACAENVD